MKIKGSAKKLRALPVVAALCVLAVAFIGLRFYQSAAQIDPATGFFMNESHWSVPLFYVLAGVLVIGAPVLLYLTPLSRAEGIAIRRRPVHAAAALCFASFILAECISVWKNRGAADIAGDESVRNLFTSERLAVAFLVLGALSVLSLVIDAVDFLACRGFIKKIGLLRLAPPVWAGIATLNIFTVTVSYLHNSTLLLLIFGNVSMMLFLFAYARKVSSIAGDENSPFFFVTAVLTVAFQLAATLPTLFKVCEPIAHCDFEWYRVAGAVYAVTAIAVVLLDKSPDIDAELPAAEPEDPEAVEEAVEESPEAIPDGDEA
ncbi:MAG: hypothetical protein IK104_11375 [Clostridia bacterium]|nr:hypothetical protein [Clostridia bacterium]